MPRRSLPWRHDNITSVRRTRRPSPRAVAFKTRQSLNVRFVFVVPPHVCAAAKASRFEHVRGLLPILDLRVRSGQGSSPALSRERSGRICPAVEGGDHASIAFAKEKRVLRPLRAARPKRGRGG